MKYLHDQTDFLKIARQKIMLGIFNQKLAVCVYANNFGILNLTKNSKCGNFFIKVTIKNKKLTKYINRMFG